MPESVEPQETTVELTLTIEGKVEPHKLVKDFDPDHAYGPVKNIRIERDMYSAFRHYDIIDASAEEV